MTLMENLFQTTGNATHRTSPFRRFAAASVWRARAGMACASCADGIRAQEIQSARAMLNADAHAMRGANESNERHATHAAHDSHAWRGMHDLQGIKEIQEVRSPHGARQRVGIRCTPPAHRGDRALHGKDREPPGSTVRFRTSDAGVRASATPASSINVAKASATLSLDMTAEEAEATPFYANFKH